MRYRTFGRAGWRVSEVGYGMWGLAGWTGSDDEETRRSLQLAVDLGCTFFDTAWAYGEGRSEQLLGELVRANSDRPLYTATKVPPKNRRWPTRRGDALEDVFPPDHIREYAERSLENLGLPSVDLLQFHVWEDDWAEDERWQGAVDELKREGLIGAVGISINRWEPWNAIRTLPERLNANDGAHVARATPAVSAWVWFVFAVPAASVPRERAPTLRSRAKSRTCAVSPAATCIPTLMFRIFVEVEDPDPQFGW